MLKVDQCYTYQIKLFTICYSLIPLLSLYIIHLSRTVIYETRDRNYFPRVCPRKYMFFLSGICCMSYPTRIHLILHVLIYWCIYKIKKIKINCLAIKFSKTIALASTEKLCCYGLYILLFKIYRRKNSYTF